MKLTYINQIPSAKILWENVCDIKNIFHKLTLNFNGLILKNANWRISFTLPVNQDG